MKRKFLCLRRLLCFVMLFCITFLATSVTTNAAPVLQTHAFSKSFEVVIYPSSGVVTDSTYSETSSGSGNSVTYTLSFKEVDGSTTGTITHGTTVDTVRLVNGDSSYTGTASPSSGSTVSTITTGNIHDSDGVRYFDTDLSFDFLPYYFNSTSFDSTYKYARVAGYSFSASSSVGSLYNNHCVFSDGSNFLNWHVFSKQSLQSTSSGVTYYAPVLSYSGHLSYALPSGTANNLSSPITLTITINFTLAVGDATDEYVANNSPTTNDVQGNNLQQQNNQITQDTNDVTHDTNNKVTSFFSSFFDNLIGVFVPESGFFSQWFSDLNTFMSQKLGFLWAPFDFIITFLNGVYSGSGSASITFPELAWIDGTVIIPETHFSFDNIGGQSFTDLRDMIYFSTDVILLGAVVMQFYQKLKLVFEGGSE